MPGLNLTRIEADERAELVSVKHYDIALDLTTSETTFRTVTRVTFDAQAGASTFIDAITDKVYAVTLNGTELDPNEVADGIRIQLPNLAEHNEVVIDADMRYMNTGEGLHRFVDPADGEVYLYSQFEVPDARRMYPCFEQPNLKATFAFTVTAPDHWQVVSNQPTPEAEPLGEGKARWAFEATPRMSTYITALVAGPYQVWRDELTSTDGRTIPLGVFARASLAEFMDPENVFTTTKQGFDFFENSFGVPYPFDKYDQLFVPEYNMGAMENAGCVTFTESYVFRSRVSDAIRERRVITILHELAHMWFGDLVTMNWWNDLWLNESFAEFISTLATVEATEWTNDWVSFLASEKTWAYRQDQLPSTHPIVAEIRDLDDVQVNFDGITYAKGASVLKQLFFWVGREAFFKGINSYFTKHAWGNTVLDDLLVELEAASGRDLKDWSKKWLETAQVNTLRPQLEVDAEGIITKFSVLQTAPAEYPTLRPHRLGIGIYSKNADGKLVQSFNVEVDIDGAETELPQLVGQHRGDLVLINDGDLAYAKIRLDEQSLRTALSSVSDIEDPLARALVLASLWDATRDAEIRPREYTRHVLEDIATETESTTRRQVLGQLATAARRFTTAEDRDEVLAVVAEDMLQLSQQAAAGSDAQFAFVRSFAAFASSDAHLDAVQALLDGSLQLEGLTVDTDLGWELLQALVAGGRAGEAEIAARHETDRTADGNRSAAHARAAIPTAAGKRAAWDSTWTNDGATNDVVRATIAGFWHTNDDALVEPFVDEYFDGILNIWNSRSYHIAEFLIEGYFPTPLASDTIVSKATAWLDANTDAPAALRRMLLEGLDDVKRALKAQERDAQD
ncbi:aminopeptidase N [Gulosibacter bifidus]|uniref:Aminopeptidase N n=1 Tax=Gulosibacter bifidus TaxID=272239 RepID=A0ABW5RLD0_9MICO|nr:aminopeptidase N [Gulosibacter bifidus]